MNAYELGRTLEPPHGLMVSSLPGFNGASPSTQNAYIMRTKRAQKRKCAFFISYAATTYNFNPLKCTHFDLPLNLTRNPNLNRPSKAAASSAVGPSCGPNPKLTETDHF